MTGWTEKRQYHRMHVALPLSYEHYDHDLGCCREYPATTVNISLGGLYFTCVHCQEQLSPGGELDITIKMPPRDSSVLPQPAIKTRGRVVRIDSVPDAPRSRGIALEFLAPLSEATIH